MLHQLPKTTQRGKQRVARGFGSGRGTKSGRGTTRHQAARTNIPLSFEGGQNRLVKKFPLLRGKGKNKPVNKTVAIRSGALNAFEAGETVSVETLFSKGMITDAQRHKKIKIYASGAVDKKLTVELTVTPGAKKQIEDAGGTIIAG